MTKALESLDVFEELGHAMDNAWLGLGFYVSGDYESALTMLLNTYPYIRSMNENLAKYEFARDQVHGVTVDAPCGQGYGSALLASSGNVVLGLDRDVQTLAKCRDRYRYSNLGFIHGDILKRDSYPVGVESIVCMDGLEHVPDGNVLVSLFYNILPVGGTLVINVPNAAVLERGKEFNQFHLVDYDARLFVDVISSQWVTGTIRYYGQNNRGDVSSFNEAFSGWIAVCTK